jgi:hypothetical protein
LEPVESGEYRNKFSATPDWNFLNAQELRQLRRLFMWASGIGGLRQADCLAQRRKNQNKPEE